MPNKRIFDCFIFFNELDLLDIRLEECWEYVDYFVICEATRTFRGAPKSLVFAENKDRYAKYLDKIRHVVVDDMPMDGDAWKREFFQRNALKRGFHDGNPDDIIIVSDCDEIVKTDTLVFLRNNSGYFMLDMPMYQFFMNMMAVPDGWNKPYAFTYAFHDRVADLNDGRRLTDEVFQRFAGMNYRVPGAGWHFTFLGGPARVISKIQAYSHAETWQQRMLQPGGADFQMLILKDVGGGRFLEYCDVDASYPAAMRRKQKELTEQGLIKDARTRITELRTVVAQFERDREALFARNGYLEKEIERLASKFEGEVNIALNKPSTQSSISTWSMGKTNEEDARGGNNGQISGLYGFHTAEEQDPWWRVDLKGVYLVHTIRIFNRHDQAHRLRHFSILGSTDDLNWTPLYQKADDTVFGANMEPYDVVLEGEKKSVT